MHSEFFAHANGERVSGTPELDVVPNDRVCAEAISVVGRHSNTHAGHRALDLDVYKHRAGPNDWS